MRIKKSLACATLKTTNYAHAVHDLSYTAQTQNLNNLLVRLFRKYNKVPLRY